MNKRETSYGQTRLSLVDKLGVGLSYLAIKKHLPQSFNNILDIGCGFNASLLLKVGREKYKYGIDFKVQTKLNNASTTLIEGDGLTKLKELATTFDVIMLISTLEHIANPAELLNECFHHLNPAGRLLINVPTWIGKPFLEFSAFQAGFSPLIEMNDHKMYYDKRDLWPLLVKAGFLPQYIKLQYHKCRLNLFATAIRVTK